MELDRTTFRRPVWFQIAWLVTILPIAAYEALHPRYARFESLFSDSVTQAFGNAGHVWFSAAGQQA